MSRVEDMTASGLINAVVRYYREHPEEAEKFNAWVEANDIN
jgi:hypothetical protein